MNSFDETFDFVVVGSGGGSMCSALVLRQSGKSVAVLEKTSLIGGTTARSGGVMWIPNNRFMKRDGVPDSTEQAITYLEAVSGGRNDTPGSTAGSKIIARAAGCRGRRIASPSEKHDARRSLPLWCGLLRFLELHLLHPSGYRRCGASGNNVCSGCCFLSSRSCLDGSCPKGGVPWVTKT